jgi:hypothetical protein
VSDQAVPQLVDDPRPAHRPRHAATPPRESLRPRFSDTRWFTALVAILYVAVSLLANSGVWLHGVTHTIQTAGGSDVEEEIWFLAQTPWAIVHGVNPFANNFLNAPTGVNLMDNTTMPLLGVLGAPITFLLGPIAAFNIMLNLALAGSAMAFYVMARRFIRWRPAAFVGGLLYGFSPFVAAQGVGHIFLVAGFIPPLVVLFLDRFFRTKSDPPWLTGVLVGGCFVAEFYISEEVFASMVVFIALAAVLGGVSALIRRPRVEVSRLTRMGGCAIAVIALGSGFGIWTAVAGPQHINGPEQSLTTLAGLSSDPVGFVVPTQIQRFTFGQSAFGDSLVGERNANWRLVIATPTESGSYVGIPLLVILIVGAIALRRRRLVQFAVVMALAGMLLSMGSYLHFDGHRTRIPLPFNVLTHLPLVDGGAAGRYVEFFWLFAALLFVAIVDALYARVVGWDRPVDRLRATAVSVAVVICGLIPLVPVWPYASGPANVPSWFTTSARSIPIGTTLVVYPMASLVNASAMVWQAMAHVTFKMPGGYAVFRNDAGKATFVATSSLLQEVFAQCAMGEKVDLAPSILRSELRKIHASLAVVPTAVPGARCATHMFRAAYGQPRSEGGVRIWNTSEVRARGDL